jgi:sugar diacid utilization regulator
MKKVCVIDGQGGGIGSTIIKRIKERFEESVEVIALGTNAQMAEAVSCSQAKKVLLPLTQENIAIVGMVGSPLPQLVDELLDVHLPMS